MPIIAIVGLALSSNVSAKPIAAHSHHDGNAGQTQQQIAEKSQGVALPSASVIQPDVKLLTSPHKPTKAKPQPCPEQQHAIDNLKAQQDMATASRRMVYVAGTEALITLLGVILVGFTLYHTRESAKATRDAVKEAEKATAVAQQAVGMERAWITLGGFDCGSIPAEKTMEPSRGLHGFGYIVTWKNTGRTPALRLTCYTDYRIVFPPETIPTFDAGEPPMGGLKSAPLGPGDTIRTIPNQLRLDDVEMLAHLVVYSRVEYYDLTSSIMRISEICARVETTPQMRPDGTIGGGFALVPVGRQNTAS